MTKEEQRKIVDTKVEIEGKYMMGTEAIHLLGNISSDVEDLFYVTAETEKYWVGSWVTGFEFINVLFPKETSRELTPGEIEYYNSRSIQINSQPPIKLKVN